MLPGALLEQVVGSTPGTTVVRFRLIPFGSMIQFVAAGDEVEGMFPIVVVPLVREANGPVAGIPKVAGDPKVIAEV
jgi:hypothetical protein